MIYEVGDLVVVRKRRDIDPTKKYHVLYVHEMEKCAEKCFKVIKRFKYFNGEYVYILGGGEELAGDYCWLADFLFPTIS